MQLEIKFKSITLRWFLNIFLIVAIIVSAVAIIASAVFTNINNERIADLASDYASEFYALSGTNYSTFNDTAISIAGEFQHKDKIEVQVIDFNGKVVVSTTGFPLQKQEMPDYTEAVKNNSTVTKNTYNTDGEPIMSSTTLIYDNDNNFLGAYRWITSMTAARKMTNNFIVFIVLISLLILSLSAVSGIFFIKSIVQPIRDVSNIARKIAMGDFEARIEITRNDEIGELCDTINYMASELSQAENLKNDFISSVSHELRTPLTAIRGGGETAKMS
ncbi:MAG: HAMP domain-containing protein, partial [Clostridia bacterium]|nr:HAMP domain-containing protein [Clostridia bacterium]